MIGNESNADTHSYRGLTRAVQTQNTLLKRVDESNADTDTLLQRVDETNADTDTHPYRGLTKTVQTQTHTVIDG